jgi:S-formylglutathione hydrolase FrmB
MIIVMPDAFNRYGGSFYTNSSVAGNYEDYITQDIAKYIDNNYRTLPQSASRAIGGGSMGGYGAMKLAMKHPEVYCAVVSHSGPLSLNIRKDMIRLNPGRMLNGYPVHRAWAIALTPNPDSKLLYDYPADDEGNLIEEVWQRWLEHDLLTMIQDNIGNLEQLAGIYFDQGRSDNLVSVNEARDFDQALTEAGIPHVYEEYNGGHTDQWTSRLYTALPFLSELLSYEMLTGVEPVGKLAAMWGEIKR